MEKKNNKKLFAIIGGSVLAFILTIALSVSITLAYFGDTRSSNDLTLSLGQTVEFNGNVTASVEGAAELTGMLPGESRTVDLKGTVTSTTTSYYLRFKLSATNTGEGSKVSAAAPVLEATGVVLPEGYKLEQVGGATGYYYLVGSDNKPVVLTKGASESDNDAYTISMTVTVDKSVTNSTELAEVKVTGEMGIIQSQFLTENNAEITTATQLEGLWTDVDRTQNA